MCLKKATNVQVNFHEWNDNNKKNGKQRNFCDLQMVLSQENANFLRMCMEKKNFRNDFEI